MPWGQKWWFSWEVYGSWIFGGWGMFSSFLNLFEQFKRFQMHIELFYILSLDTRAVFSMMGQLKRIIAKEKNLGVHTPSPPFNYLKWIIQYTLYSHNISFGGVLRSTLRTCWEEKGTWWNIVRIIWQLGGNFKFQKFKNCLKIGFEIIPKNKPKLPLT